MSTQCTPPPLAFHAFGRRQVVGRFDAGRLTSDGGTLLLREVARRLGLMRRVAGCFTDYRDPDKVEHSVLERVTQRVGGIALGYEDLNDHDALRTDSLLALWAGKADLTGAQRSRERDRGYALAGSSTLNRLELSRPEAAAPGIATTGLRRIRMPWTGCWWIFSWTPTPRCRKKCGWIWTPRTIRCTAIRRGVSFTATTGPTVTCRCTSSAVSICCVRGCGRRTRTPVPVASRS